MSDDGVDALFGGGSEKTPQHRIQIVCSRCGATTGVPILDLLERLVRFSLWLPGRHYPRRLRCPACNARSWVRLQWR